METAWGEGFQKKRSSSMATKGKETKSTVKAAPAKTTASSKTTQEKKSSTKSKSASHDEIAKHAFMLWQKRGGSELQNWLDAERSLS
jgi:hypothetical protein